jgi:hypothetical protein
VSSRLRPTSGFVDVALRCGFDGGNERKLQEGNGRSDAVRLLARNILRGVHRREDAHVAGRDLRITGSDAHRNAANPRSGSGMQQAREPDAEQTVEVVQNHEGGP